MIGAFLGAVATAVIGFAAFMMTGFNPIAAGITIKLVAEALALPTLASVVGFYAGKKKDDANVKSADNFRKNVDAAVKDYLNFASSTA